MFDMKENLKMLPDKPGVYLYKDRFGEILYVGKATSLKNRVRQYFQSPKNLPPKVRALVSHIDEFEYIITDSEMEALILENNLIKKNQPRYNILLRDDKTYPYIKVTLNEEFPRVVKTRRVLNDGGKYFGPYTDVGAVNQMIELLNKVYPLKKCSAGRFPEGFRPCLNSHIGACLGICGGGVSKQEYDKMVESVVAFLQGKDDSLRRELEERMKRAAEAFEFEKAAEYRDYLAALSLLDERQIIVTSPNVEVDVIVATQGVKDYHVMIFYVRDGKLIGRESYQVNPQIEGNETEVVATFIKQYYSHDTLIPREIVVDGVNEDFEAIGAWLSAVKGSNVRFTVPQKGEKKALLSMARSNIDQMKEVLEKRVQNEEEKTQRLSEALKEVLGLFGKLERIEAYDISNTSGVDSVGVMVVFENGKKRVKDYRKFKIKTVEGPNDYGSLQEVIYRRFRNFQKAADTLSSGGDRLPENSFEKRPDLLLIDGGEKQAAAVEQVLSAMGLDIPVVGMVKDDKHRTRDLVYRGQLCNLKENEELYKFIYFIQEEVHRFAITYHRSLRGKSVARSVLDQIPGIGEKRRNGLLAHFGSVEAIKKAELAELAAAPGMNLGAAEAVKAFFEEQKKRSEEG